MIIVNGLFTGKEKKKRWLTVIVLVTAPGSTAILILFVFGNWICIRKKKKMETEKAEIEDIRNMESLQFDIDTIIAATCNFSVDNKLGEGGFVFICSFWGEKNALPSYDKFDELIDKKDVGEEVKSKFFHNFSEMFMECSDSFTEQREVFMNRVNNFPNASVLFGSIKARGEGISLVGASRIMILDVHFNPSASDQAIRHAF
ncbi:hypothetical protein Cgig2_002955 [Carnegiea gigantea]|uniref:Helicase C-terminal domain-containing protein n=1 Tax=Carnegiea gigantea TaxID=171969 RepID=A0A9Q1GNJ2_9CARY|nr:hypothetical protein Cgig2_002955 [Carnegiea gigantea]